MWLPVFERMGGSLPSKIICYWLWLWLVRRGDHSPVTRSVIESLTFYWDALRMCHKFKHDERSSYYCGHLLNCFHPFFCDLWSGEREGRWGWSITPYQVHVCLFVCFLFLWFLLLWRGGEGRKGTLQVCVIDIIRVGYLFTVPVMIMLMIFVLIMPISCYTHHIRM